MTAAVREGAVLDTQALRADGCFVVRGAVDPRRCAVLGRAVLAEHNRLQRAGQGFAGPGRLAGNAIWSPAHQARSLSLR